MYRPKEAKRIDYLDIASKALPILATLGMVLGGMWTFSYLSSIHQLSLFADVMGEPSSLAAVVVVFFLMFFSVSIGFFAPYFFLVFWEDVNKSSLLVEYFQPIGEDCIVRVTRLFVTLLSSFISVFIFLILLFFKLLSPCLLIFCFIIPFCSGLIQQDTFLREY